MTYFEVMSAAYFANLLGWATMALIFGSLIMLDELKNKRDSNGKNDDNEEK